jgi:hypothetical protein
MEIDTKHNRKYSPLLITKTEYVGDNSIIITRADRVGNSKYEFSSLDEISRFLDFIYTIQYNYDLQEKDKYNKKKLEEKNKHAKRNTK